MILTNYRARLRLSSRGLLPATPAFIWLCLFFLIPTAMVSAFSFGSSNLFGSNLVDLSAPSLDRYREVGSATFRVAFMNTVQLSAVGTMLCLAIAFPMAYLISTKLTGKWKYLAIIGVIVPFWMPFLLRTYSWRLLLGEHGPLTTLFGIDCHGMLDSMSGAQLGVVYNYLPLAVLPIVVALDRLDPALRMAGRDLGASPWRVFWQVTVPAARPGLISAGVLVFIPLMGDYVTPAVLGGVNVFVVGALISDSFLVTQDWALGAAAAVFLIVLVAVVLSLAGLLCVGLRRVLHLLRPLDLAARLPRPNLPLVRRQVSEPVLRVYGVAFLVFLWSPILTVAAYSFNQGRSLAVWDGPGFRWYAAIPENNLLTDAVGQSVLVAVLSTVIALLIGTLAGIALANSHAVIRRGLTVILMVVFVTPEIVAATGSLMLYLQTGPLMADGTTRLVISHSVVSTVMVAFVVSARLKSLDTNLLAAGADLGATPLQVLRRVLLPIAAPAIAAGAVLASTFSLDDVIASSIVSTVGSTTLPVVIYSTLRTGLKGDAAAASTLMMAATALAVCLTAAVLARAGHGRSFLSGLTGG
ncbi:hypothetical protein A5784_08025 [Mycobacterium sp. 852013-50091_SCH5140682]|uniref:ABC transporter permease subunit n=1 Tax=Mycobacterium sp. 852013-50091_SCH5140682 TaxID=1834109 RepID=UPI0007EB9353|nr:ABC transporter permease subunit [Mycobacterium sp. 852013-50091_SCH5140682]OBC07733.1 hypothetical protein A5784_08025 [Mycobacterium sp. 852013-50091_SCH5140682]